MTDRPSGRRTERQRSRIERGVVDGHTIWVERDAIGIVEISDSRQVVESDAEARRRAAR
jgi:hypothetical protein